MKSKNFEIGQNLEFGFWKWAKILNSGFWKAKIFKSAKILNSEFWKAKILESAKMLNSRFLKA